MPKKALDILGGMCYYNALSHIITCEGGVDMQAARMLGNYIDHIAKSNGLSISELSKVLNCTETQVYSLIKGRAYASFDQLSKLAEALGISFDQMLSGDLQSYNASVVHCMNDFQDTSNREKILDLIDDYIDIIDAVTMDQ